MSLSAASDLALRAGRAFKKGKVSSLGLESVLNAIKAQQGAERGGLFPDPKESDALLVVGSTAQVAIASPARVYGVRAVSGSLKAIPSTSTADVVVAILDGDVTVGSVKLTTNGDAEAYFFGKDGVGILCLTNVGVKAFAVADGTSDPATGDKPTVTVLYG